MKEILRLVKLMMVFLYVGLCYGDKVERNNTNFHILDTAISISHETSPVFKKKTKELFKLLYFLL